MIADNKTLKPIPVVGESTSTDKKQTAEETRTRSLSEAHLL
jgi:hypothetical protein